MLLPLSGFFLRKNLYVYEESFAQQVTACHAELKIQ